jgi:hypothetical protein
MSKFSKSFILCIFMTLCLVCIPLQGTPTYDASAAGGCGEDAEEDEADAHPDARGFYDKIITFTNWSGNFYKKYSECEESQYASGSSNEGSWIDTSHIHYHVSHGGSHTDEGNNDKSLTAVVFEGESLSTDETYLDASEAKDAWGDGTLNWIAFRCCKLLDKDSWEYWAETMNGLHLILGFHTISVVDDDFGKTWADKMQTQTIAQAWFSTVDSTQSFFVTARIIGETDECYKDYLHGMGSSCDDPTADDTKSTWVHRAGGLFTLLNPGDITQVRRHTVIPRIIDAVNVRLIGEAFGFGIEDDVIEEEDYFYMARTEGDGPDPQYPGKPSHILYVYKNSGIYYYQNLCRLWRVDLDDPPGIYPEEAAPARAYAFLTDSSHINLYPNDVHAYSVDADEIARKNIDNGESLSYQVHQSVTYCREVPAEIEVPASVVGPGARLKVYIDEDGGIIGAMGNWRETQSAGMVNIMSREAAWNLFEQDGQQAVLNPIYLKYDSVQTDLTTAVIGYYEAPCLENQAELVPVWIFNTNYYKDGVLIETAYTYVPAVTS